MDYMANSIDTSYWHETPDGGYCTEMSMIASGGGRSFMTITLPNGVKKRLGEFVVKRDIDNEVTHWELVLGGIKYIIFND